MRCSTGPLDWGEGVKGSERWQYPLWSGPLFPEAQVWCTPCLYIALNEWGQVTPALLPLTAAVCGPGNTIIQHDHQLRPTPSSSSSELDWFSCLQRWRKMSLSSSMVSLTHTQNSKLSSQSVLFFLTSPDRKGESDTLAPDCWHGPPLSTASSQDLVESGWALRQPQWRSNHCVYYWVKTQEGTRGEE